MQDKPGIKVGAMYLFILFQRHGDWDKAVLAYNRGRLKGDPMDYVNKIKNNIITLVRPFNRKYPL